MKMDKNLVLVEHPPQNSKYGYLYIFSNTLGLWIEYPVPETPDVIEKGSVGRTLLKELFGSDPDLVEKELPPNDYDYIAKKTHAATQCLQRLGADPDGVEWVDDIDFTQLMNNRDLDINNAFVGNNGIYFSEDAKNAAATGKIEIVSTKRGIYGSEIFYYDGIRLLKNRGIMRLLKTLAEGKASSFDFLPLNKQVELGIYWLILAKRFSSRKDFPEIMDRLFESAKQIGQVPEDCTDVIQILDTIHNKYPFYNFDGAPLDEAGVTRWLSKKLLKQIRKKYRDKYQIPSGILMSRSPGDTIPYEVSLKNYQPDNIKLEHFSEEWAHFLSRCRRRLVNYEENEAGDLDE